jgi:hypothetical protein
LTGIAQVKKLLIKQTVISLLPGDMTTPSGVKKGNPKALGRQL